MRGAKCNCISLRASLKEESLVYRYFRAYGALREYPVEKDYAVALTLSLTPNSAITSRMRARLFSVIGTSGKRKFSSSKTLPSSKIYVLACDYLSALKGKIIPVPIQPLVRE